MKAILVIDMPKNCAECKLMHLQGIGESICDAVDWKERPSWCPLKPMPNKRGDITLTERTQDIDMLRWQLENKLITKGWNNCLDEILGEEKC